MLGSTWSRTHNVLCISANKLPCRVWTWLLAYFPCERVVKEQRLTIVIFRIFSIPVAGLPEWMSVTLMKISLSLSWNIIKKSGNHKKIKEYTILEHHRLGQRTLCRSFSIHQSNPLLCVKYQRVGTKTIASVKDKLSLLHPYGSQGSFTSVLWRTSI